MRLQFYRVKKDYTDVLSSVNPRGVTVNNDGHINTYIGILFNINGCDYIAPLTHTSLPNKWHQQPIIVTNQNDETTNLLGTILFHNMIPVYEGVCEKVDLDDYQINDIRRYNLYSEQLVWINEIANKESIRTKAELTYQIHHDPTHPDHSFLNGMLSCKFSELENAMNDYKK